MLITIQEIKAKTIVGAWAFEKKKKQPIRINCYITYDTSLAIKSDSIKNALDYYELTREIISKVESNKFELLEKLTDCVLKIILLKPQVISAKVQVFKPKALKPFASNVSITAEGKN
jgi:D-erythro-7,8-dihydroneopterin triphosphate epimerase